MERLATAISQAERALLSLQTVVAIANPTDIERDAAIQRFEFTFEIVWKTARIYLRETEGIEAASPKAVVRACHSIGMLSQDEATHALEIADDRNLTSHTYNQDLAIEIFRRLPSHATLLAKWLMTIKERSVES